MNVKYSLSSKLTKQALIIKSNVVIIALAKCDVWNFKYKQQI